MCGNYWGTQQNLNFMSTSSLTPSDTCMQGSLSLHCLRQECGWTLVKMSTPYCLQSWFWMIWFCEFVCKVGWFWLICSLLWLTTDFWLKSLGGLWIFRSLSCDCILLVLMKWNLDALNFMESWSVQLCCIGGNIMHLRCKIFIKLVAQRYGY